MKRLAIATLVVALSFGITMAQDKPATDKPAAPKTTEKAKDAGCGESTGCCGEMKSSKDKKAEKSQKSTKKTTTEAAKPEAAKPAKVN
jgi:hypothetical protein